MKAIFISLINVCYAESVPKYLLASDKAQIYFGEVIGHYDIANQIYC